MTTRAPQYDAGGGQSQVAYTWDNANRRTCLTLPNGVLASYGYDKDSRPDIEFCFNNCFNYAGSGGGYGQAERNPRHYHFQTRPGRGGVTGFAPGVR